MYNNKLRICAAILALASFGAVLASCGSSDPANTKTTQADTAADTAIATEEAEKKAAREAAKAKEEPKAEEPAEEEKVAEITYDDFAKVNLIVGEIRDCQPVPKADKLLNNTVWDGKRERTILSGIHEWYEPADLIGKKVIIVDNLAPRKMRGFVSEGMLLAADMPDGSAKVIILK